MLVMHVLTGQVAWVVSESPRGFVVDSNGINKFWHGRLCQTVPFTDENIELADELAYDR